MSGEPLVAALGYAERGLRVIPLHDVTQGHCSCQKRERCPTPGKHPRLTAWEKKATTNRGTITGWFSHWTDAGVGIVTGAASGLLVLDVDPRNGGTETLRRFVAEHGPLPETAVVETGGGGLHYYFAHPGGRVEGRELGPGLELKGEGQLVVAPPSLTGEAP